ncbi:THAP domain-containing protein 3 [Diachasma alloeum]|uniref:THAP domain-containing protein 3 n=1 Tax=Diachasma alloeum TaxID=454923 RepID=UPI000738283B|nr:THAP domain-containing protein 3 [Diachasma alloeum]
MVRNCCVKGCKSLWHPTANLSFFRFPFKTPQLMETWLAVVPSKGNISKTSVVCNKHFQNFDFNHEGSRRTLKDIAVPSIFPSDGSMSVARACPEGAAHQTMDVGADSSEQNTTTVLKTNDVLPDLTNVTRIGGNIKLDDPVILENLDQGQHCQPKSKANITPPNYVTMPRETADAMRRQIIILQKKKIGYLNENTVMSLS